MKQMQKLLCLFLVVVMVCLMAACTKQEAVSNGDTRLDIADRANVERAVQLLREQWETIAAEDAGNDGYLEIKNTRIVHTDTDAMGKALGLGDIQCIVEFVIFTDFYGAAPYYYETQHMNNVVFCSDGTATVLTNAVQTYFTKTYDASLKNCAMEVLDCKTAFNQTFDLK
jgi:hypothetical protein